MNASSENKPWIRYDILTRSIIEISIGERPAVGHNEGCTETTMEVAVGFLEGTMNPQQFVIPNDGTDAESSVASRADTMIIKTCWMLVDVGSESSPVEISTVTEDGIVVRSRINNNPEMVIYITEKDDPNALLRSWVISISIYL